MLFEASKRLLTSTKVLTHFDTAEEILLAFDASLFGVGAVLSHKKKGCKEKTHSIMRHVNAIHYFRKGMVVQDFEKGRSQPLWFRRYDRLKKLAILFRVAC